MIPPVVGFQVFFSIVFFLRPLQSSFMDSMVAHCLGSDVDVDPSRLLTVDESRFPASVRVMGVRRPFGGGDSDVLASGQHSDPSPYPAIDQYVAQHLISEGGSQVCSLSFFSLRPAIPCRFFLFAHWIVWGILREILHTCMAVRVMVSP